MINIAATALITLGIVSLLGLLFLQAMADDRHMHPPGTETLRRGNFKHAVNVG